MSQCYKPPKEVQKTAKQGLKLRREHNRGGTRVGVARARDLSNNRCISLKTVKRTYSFLARNQQNKCNNSQDTSAGCIADKLWGGDHARRWTKRILGK